MPSVQEIEQQIADLEAEKQRLLMVQTQGWPKLIEVYVHASREQMYEQGVKIGFTGESLQEFSYLACEVKLEYLVSEDGTPQLVRVDGRPLAGEP